MKKAIAFSAVKPTAAIQVGQEMLPTPKLDLALETAIETHAEATEVWLDKKVSWYELPKFFNNATQTVDIIGASVELKAEVVSLSIGMREAKVAQWTDLISEAYAIDSDRASAIVTASLDLVIAGATLGILVLQD
tara:strand:+ start:1891 stop:2295 length:405 start_codon:yes stop_codon:yes gene_type:complete